ncbi:MAG: hypothetical protein RR800_12940, partial [Comamonas sp.]
GLGCASFKVQRTLTDSFALVAFDQSGFPGVLPLSSPSRIRSLRSGTARRLACGHHKSNKGLNLHEHF